jgi:hypothetical protein
LRNASPRLLGGNVERNLGLIEAHLDSERRSWKAGAGVSICRDAAGSRRKASMIGRAVPTVFIDNDRVRVTEWRFAAGAATGWHRHEMDYVAVPLGDGMLAPGEAAQVCARI